MDDPLSGSLWGQLFFQLILILVNAFFAATEIAVLTVNESKLRRAAEEGDKKAEKLLKFVTEPSSFLSTIQVGITLAGFLGSAFAAQNFAGIISGWLEKLTGTPQSNFYAVSVVIVTVILSFFTLVLGELVPKRIAMKKAEAVASGTLNIIRMLSAIMRPVVWSLSVSTNGILRLFGINPKEDPEDFTEEEIRMMVGISEKSGNIDSTEREMIENIFEFNNSCAADLMVHRTQMVALEIDDDEETILNTIIESGRSRIPIYKEDIDDIIGVLNIRRYLVNRQLQNPLPLEALLYKPHFVSESVRADVLFRDMQKKKIHLAIVLDEFGGTSGLITMEDLLEEIVGNIYDEFDSRETEDFTAISENKWKVSGGIDLEVLSERIGSEKIGVELSDDEAEYSTLGGLVFSLLPEIPPDGSTPEVQFGNLHIRATVIAEKRLEWAEIVLNQEAPVENTN